MKRNCQSFPSKPNAVINRVVEDKTAAFAGVEHILDRNTVLCHKSPDIFLHELKNIRPFDLVIDNISEQFRFPPFLAHVYLLTLNNFI